MDEGEGRHEPGRAWIEIRLIGGSHADGEVPLKTLADIAASTHDLVHG